jgi:hypothetical protein
MPPSAVASRHASAEEASRERNYAATCSADRVRVAGAGRRACRSLARSHKLRSAAAVLGERGAARANAAAARAREELSATDAAFVEESALDAVEAAAAAVETLDAFQPPPPGEGGGRFRCGLRLRLSNARPRHCDLAQRRRIGPRECTGMSNSGIPKQPTNTKT